MREFVALLDAMDELKPRVEAGVLVDQRRWNLRLKSGVDVKLPEDNPAGRDRRASHPSAPVPDPGQGRAGARFPGSGPGVRAPVRGGGRRLGGRPCGQEGRPAMSLKPLAPRMRQIPARKSAILSVLDVGASKIVCLIARLTPMEPSEALRGRTHRCKVLGVGHQRSSGVKGGAVVDLQAAEHAARLAIDAAERMAGVEVGGVIVNMSGGRLGLASPRRGRCAARQDRRRARPPPRARGRGGGERRAWADDPARASDRLPARRDPRRARSQGHGRRTNSASIFISPPAIRRRRAT